MLEGKRVRYIPTGVTPVAVHIPFMHMDLAARSNFVRTHIINDFSPTSKVVSLHWLARHIYREAMHNPVYVASGPGHSGSQYSPEAES